MFSVIKVSFEEVPQRTCDTGVPQFAKKYINRTVSDDKQKLLNQIHQVEGTHQQCVEEWKPTFDDHVRRTDIQREEDVDKVRELNNKITEDYQHQLEKQKHSMDEVRELTEKCINTTEQQHENNQRNITALQNQLEE